MSLDETTVEGTLKEDGTLELDEKPNLAPGRVAITLRQIAEPPTAGEGWWEFMQRSRRELEASGHHFMNDEEVNAYIEELREGDRIDEMLQQTDKEIKNQERL